MAASMGSEVKSDGAALRASVSSSNDFRNQAPGSLENIYRYSPLSKRGNIRLLRLMPHKDKGAPIQCRLLEYPLQEPGQGTHFYEALSYAWGSKEDQRPI